MPEPVSPELQAHLRSYIQNFLDLPTAQQDQRLEDQINRFNEPGDVVLVRAEVVQAFSGELELRVPSPGGSTRFFAFTRDTVTI